MAQQKSERRELPQARRKAGVTGRDGPLRGGKAAPVKQETRQLGLWLGTADNRKAKARRSIAGAEAGRPAPAPREEHKPRHKEKTAPSTGMDAVCGKFFIARKLIKLGVAPKTAWRNVYEGHKSLWALSHTPAVNRGLRNAYFAERGLVSVEEKWKADARYIDVPTQLTLALG